MNTKSWSIKPALTLPDGWALDWLRYGSGHLHQIGLTEAGSGTRTGITDIERDALHRETQRSQDAPYSRYDYDLAGRLVRHQATVGPSCGYVQKQLGIKDLCNKN